MRQLTSLDAQFLAAETSRTYSHVSSLAIFDPSTAPGGRVTREDLSRVIGERLHLLPPFRWKLVEVPLGLDNPYWIEDPDFDLDFHVRETAVPPPGGRHQFAEQIARIVARPLDRARPLWEIYLVHGLARGRIALLTKVHHAAVDGTSGAEIMGMLFDPTPEGREVPPPEQDEPRRHVPGRLELLARGVAGIPRQPLRAVSGAPGALAALDDLPSVQDIPGVGTMSRIARWGRRVTGRTDSDGGVLERPSVRPPRTRFNARISAHRRFVFGSLSLDKVKAVKNAASVTVNDVVLTVCAGALRKLLSELGELPEEPLIATVPVSVRRPEEVGTFGNRVSAMVVAIPTDEPDAVQRLARMHDAMRSAKDRHSAMPADLLQDLTQFIPPALVARSTRLLSQLTAFERLPPAVNLVISNIPGPRVPLFCAGARLEANYPVSVVFDGIGLNITVASYLDHLDVGIVADREQISDLWPLMDFMSRALEELDGAVSGSGATARPAEVELPV